MDPSIPLNKGLNLNKSDQTSYILRTPKTLPMTKMSNHKIIEAQMLERRRKGLCYFYEEKWHQGHKHIKPKLCLLESMKVFDNTDHELDYEQVTKVLEVVDEETMEIISISQQAMVCIPSFKTIRVIGQLKNKMMVILVDTRSTPF